MSSTRYGEPVDATAVRSAASLRAFAARVLDVTPAEGTADEDLAAAAIAVDAVMALHGLRRVTDLSHLDTATQLAVFAALRRAAGAPLPAADPLTSEVPSERERELVDEYQQWWPTLDDQTRATAMRAAASDLRRAGDPALDAVAAVLCDAADAGASLVLEQE